MTYSDILQLIAANQNTSDWVRVNDENRDGGETSYCKADVFLTISFGLVWTAGKPFASFQIKYGSTLLGWFEIALASAAEIPQLGAILPLANNHLLAAKG